MTASPPSGEAGRVLISATGTSSCPLSAAIAERSAGSWSTHSTSSPL